VGQKTIQFRKDGSGFKIMEYLSLSVLRDKCMGREEPAALLLTAVGSTDLWLILTQAWCNYIPLSFTVYKQNIFLKTVVTL
jgi:hypothetical protein